MLDRDLIGRGVRDPRVLEAMGRVPRERFVPADRLSEAYGDGPLPIGLGQTISQPFVVAAMLEAARVGPTSRVLDVGTGSGYAAAVAAELAAEVFSIVRHDALLAHAERVLRGLGYGPARVHLRAGDGYQGWPEAAPFDAILVAATAPGPPDALLGQLRIGGRLIVPVRGANGDELLERWSRRSAVGFDRSELMPVRFVPLVPGRPGGPGPH